VADDAAHLKLSNPVRQRVEPSDFVLGDQHREALVSSTSRFGASCRGRARSKDTGHGSRTSKVTMAASQRCAGHGKVGATLPWHRRMSQQGRCERACGAVDCEQKDSLLNIFRKQEPAGSVLEREPDSIDQVACPLILRHLVEVHDIRHGHSTFGVGKSDGATGSGMAERTCA
jgi:hypothetical protein